MIALLNKGQDLLDKLGGLDFLAPLALRIFLGPIFILAGYNKLTGIENVAFWFDSIGIPAAGLMAWVAALTEFVGGILLLAGLAVRWIALPLMFTMIVAAATAHWEYGWHALPETELTMPWEWRTDLIESAVERRSRARDILEEHGNYSWLTGAGPITVLKNGIEFAATYFVMLLALFFLGAGRFISVDYWVDKRFRQSAAQGG